MMEDDDGGARVLCCECGTPTQTNPTNMCIDCLRSKVDITEGIARQVAQNHCRGCNRFERSGGWVACEPESKELLAILLKRVRGLDQVRLVDASFVWTEAHSKRIKLKLVVQKEVILNAVLQQTLVVEFVVANRQCEKCQRVEAKDYWVSVVQVRQKVQHKRTMFWLEQLILRHNAHADASSISEMRDGLDFFHSEKNASEKLVSFLQTVAPLRYKTARQMITHDTHTGVHRNKYTFSVELVPVCKDDLVCLPKETAAHLSNVCPLVLCTKARAHAAHARARARAPARHAVGPRPGAPSADAAAREPPARPLAPRARRSVLRWRTTCTLWTWGRSRGWSCPRRRSSNGPSARCARASTCATSSSSTSRRCSRRSSAATPSAAPPRRSSGWPTSPSRASPTSGRTTRSTSCARTWAACSRRATTRRATTSPRATSTPPTCPRSPRPSSCQTCCSCARRTRTPSAGAAARARWAPPRPRPRPLPRAARAGGSSGGAEHRAPVPARAHRRRVWRLKQLRKEADDGLSAMDVERSRADYETFLRDLEEDKEMRSGINLYKDHAALQALRARGKHGTAPERATGAHAAAADDEADAGAHGSAGRAARGRPAPEPMAEEEDELSEAEVGLEELLDDLTLGANEVVEGDSSAPFELPDGPGAAKQFHFT